MQKIKSYLDKLSSNIAFQHILGISLFISYEWFFILKGNTEADFLALAIVYLFDIGFFYLFGFMVLPRLDNTSLPLLLRIIFALVVIGIFSLIHLYYTRLLYWMYRQPFDSSMLFKFYKLSLTRVAYVGAAAVVVWYVRKNFKQKIEYYQMVEKNDKLEIALLRAQLNPHLLFNVLSAVQNTLTSKYPETKPLMNTLIDIFDLAMKGSNTDSEPNLQDELTLVERLVFLHEELGKNCDLQIESSVEIESLRFPPKLLATLVENVFKHGDFSAGQPLARIRITCNAETLQFSSQNVRITNSSTTGTQIGLTNSRDRLNRSFPDKYSLSFYTDSTDTFTLDLTIKLK